MALIENLEAETRLCDGNTRKDDEEQIFRAFDARITSGRLRSACRNLANRNSGGVILLLGRISFSCKDRRQHYCNYLMRRMKSKKTKSATKNMHIYVKISHLL